jgi:hypothetical protein
LGGSGASTGSTGLLATAKIELDVADCKESIGETLWNYLDHNIDIAALNLIVEEKNSVEVVNIRKSRVAAQRYTCRCNSRRLAQNEVPEVRTWNDIYEHG